jgi:hypothetical protein
MTGLTERGSSMHVKPSKSNTLDPNSEHCFDLAGKARDEGKLFFCANNTLHGPIYRVIDDRPGYEQVKPIIRWSELPDGEVSVKPETKAKLKATIEDMIRSIVKDELEKFNVLSVVEEGLANAVSGFFDDTSIINDRIEDTLDCELEDRLDRYMNDFDFNTPIEDALDYLDLDSKVEDKVKEAVENLSITITVD